MRNLLAVIFILISVLSFSQNIEVVTQEQTLGTITTIKFSPDGRYVASVGDGRNIIKVWHINSHKMVGALVAHQQKINALSFSPDGKNLISADEKGKIVHWSLDTWSVKDSLQTSEEIEFTLAAYGKEAILLGTKDGDVYQYKNKSISALEGLKKEVTALEYYAGLNTFFAGDEKGEVNAYDNKGQIKWSERIIKEPVLMLAPFDKQLAVGGKSGTIIYSNAATGDEMKEATISESNILSMDGAHDRITISTGNKELKIYDANSLKLLQTFDKKSEGNPNEVITDDIQVLDISSNGGYIATASFKETIFGNVKSKQNVVKVWDARRLALYGTLEGKVNPLEGFALDAANNRLVVLGADRAISIWDLNRAELSFRDTLPKPKIEFKKPEPENVEPENVAGNIRDIASGNIGGIFNRNKDKVEKAVVKVLKRAFTQTTLLGFTPNGKYFFTRIPKDELRRYVLEDGELKEGKAIQHNLEHLNAFTFDKNSEYMACAGSGEEGVSIIDVESGEMIKKLETPGNDTKLDYLFEAKSIAFNPDGSLLAVCFNTGKVYVFRTGSWSKVFENVIPGNIGITKGAYVNFTPDGKKMVVNTVGGLKVYDPSSFQVFGEKQLSIQGTPVALNEPSPVAVTVFDRKVNFENIETGDTYSYGPIENDWITDVGMARNGMLGLSLRNGSFVFLDPNTGKEMMSFVGEGDDYIFKTDENYYKVTKNGFDLVTFRIGREAYPFEQFDVRLNRPDIVLKRLGCEDEQLMKMYKKAYEKRVEKLGYELADFESEIQLPSSSITNKNEIPASTENPEITLNIKATSENYPLEKLHVWINNVPVFGKKGKAISGQSLETTETITLAQGFNKVEVAAFDNKGNESIRDVVEVNVTGNQKSNLYLITIGTSDYKDDRFDLNFAAKDAKDLAALFEANAHGQYNEIIQKSLTNEEVVKDNFKALKEVLKNTTVNDKVIVFIAGHGVLDANFDYYYGTYNMDFENPQENGLAYNEIEAILDEIKANKKLLIMDTCHSGEVDKDEVEIAETAEVVEGDVSFRSVGPALKENEISPTKMMRELFNDVRRGTGTIVISSAGGAEFAMESGEWKNGLFTYALLLGLRSGKADLNEDGKIMLSELQSYVVDRVTKLSGGKQVPNTRVQNVALDYVIW